MKMSLNVPLHYSKQSPTNRSVISQQEELKFVCVKRTLVRIAKNKTKTKKSHEKSLPNYFLRSECKKCRGCKCKSESNREECQSSFWPRLSCEIDVYVRNRNRKKEIKKTHVPACSPPKAICIFENRVFLPSKKKRQRFFNITPPLRPSLRSNTCILTFIIVVNTFVNETVVRVRFWTMCRRGHHAVRVLFDHDKEIILHKKHTEQ